MEIRKSSSDSSSTSFPDGNDIFKTELVDGANLRLVPAFAKKLKSSKEKAEWAALLVCVLYLIS